MLPPQLQDDGNPQVAALMQQLQQMDGHAKQAVGQLQQQLQQVNQQLVAEKQKNMQGMAKLQIDARKADIYGPCFLGVQVPDHCDTAGLHRGGKSQDFPHLPALNLRTGKCPSSTPPIQPTCR